MKETGQDKEIESFDNFWDDEPRDRRPGPPARRLSQFVLGGFAAVLIVLLMVFMFSDRDPPEKPGKTAQSELVIPLDSPAADEPGTYGRQPVPPLAADSENEAPFSGSEAGVDSHTADGSLASGNAGQSTMDVRPDVASSAPDMAQAQASSPNPQRAPVPYELGMAPRPAARPEAAAPKTSPVQQNDTGKIVAAVPGEAGVNNAPEQQTSREASLQARLARENNVASQSASPAGGADSSKAATKFLVQLGAFKTRENADRLLQSLGSNGQVKLRVVEDGAKGVFKVQSGPYSDVTEARQIREQIMRQAGNVQPIIVSAP